MADQPESGAPEHQTLEIDGADARRFLFVLRILFGALCSSLVIYVAIAYIVVGRAQSERPWERPAASPMLLWIFAGVGAATAGIIPFMRRRLLPPAARPVEGVERVPKIAAVRALGRLMSAQIVSWALCEAIGVYGLIVALTNYQPHLAVAFAAAAAVNMAIYAPRTEHVRGVLFAVTAGDPRSP